MAQVTAANVSDGTMLLPLVDAIPKVRGKVGAPRRRPDSITADKAYHSNFREVMLHVKGIEPLLPRRGTDDDTSTSDSVWRESASRTGLSSALASRRSQSVTLMLIASVTSITPTASNPISGALPPKIRDQI